MTSVFHDNRLSARVAVPYEKDNFSVLPPLFMEQTGGLTPYQFNMLRAIVDGQHTQWASQEILDKYNLGTKHCIIYYFSSIPIVSPST